MSKEIIVERGTKTVYRDGDTIVKQFKAGYPKSAVIKEAFNHALAEEVESDRAGAAVNWTDRLPPLTV